jgi:predicted phage baseplate assembly protein
VPEAGRAIRFSQYRFGGGVTGNGPADKLQVLKSSIPYIDRVTNMRRAEGGRDPESLEEVKMRARRELRAQQRAVTAEDYEDLSKGASRAVARVKCNAPGNGNGALPPGMIELLIVPAATEALRAGDLSKLQVDQAVKDQVEAHLDQYRLLTTTLRIREPGYIGVKVKAEIVVAEYSRPELVRARVIEALKNFITPLALGPNDFLQNGALAADWAGWPFGRDLYVAEIFSLIQQVPGVKHVIDVQLWQRPITPSAEASSLAGEESEEAEKGLLAIDERMLHVPPDTLLCSLEHEIQLVEL